MCTYGWHCAYARLAHIQVVWGFPTVAQTFAIKIKWHLFRVANKPRQTKRQTDKEGQSDRQRTRKDATHSHSLSSLFSSAALVSGGSTSRLWRRPAAVKHDSGTDKPTQPTFRVISRILCKYTQICDSNNNEQGKQNKQHSFFCAFASFFDLQSIVIVVLSLLVSSCVCRLNKLGTVCQFLRKIKFYLFIHNIILILLMRLAGNLQIKHVMRGFSNKTFQ